MIKLGTPKAWSSPMSPMVDTRTFALVAFADSKVAGGDLFEGAGRNMISICSFFCILETSGPPKTRLCVSALPPLEATNYTPTH